MQIMNSGRGTALFIGYVIFFAWLDWILHRSIVFVVVVGGGLIVAALFRTRIGVILSDSTHRRVAEIVRPFANGWSRIPERIQRFLIALTPLLYFVTRGQGTSDAGAAVAVAGAIVAAVTIFLGPAMDTSLSGFYHVRNRVLGRTLRLVLAPIIGILIAFVIVHGSIQDLTALFGGSTESPQSPVGMIGTFFLATLLAGACTFLLLRETGERE